MSSSADTFFIKCNTNKAVKIDWGACLLGLPLMTFCSLNFTTIWNQFAESNYKKTKNDILGLVRVIRFLKE